MVQTGPCVNSVTLGGSPVPPSENQSLMKILFWRVQWIIVRHADCIRRRTKRQEEGVMHWCTKWQCLSHHWVITTQQLITFTCNKYQHSHSNHVSFCNRYYCTLLFLLDIQQTMSCVWYCMYCTYSWGIFSTLLQPLLEP